MTASHNDSRQPSPIIVVSRRLDCLGQMEPMPLLQLRAALETMVAGQILELIWDDPCAPADVAAWCRVTGHELIDVYDRGDQVSFFIRCKERIS
ncbi:MAG: sulfurtransferase TusA family protein [candidate division KSB1 bacterium]|nr:sulfurtransferase TusA family protein [candidate division KSB1 bacterium]